MSAGKLINRLGFEKRALVDDALGNKEGDWVWQFTLSARIMPLKGSETVIAQRLVGMQPVIITVYKSAKSDLIQTGWRAVDRLSGTSYNIHTKADMTEKRQEYEMMADAGGPDG